MVASSRKARGTKPERRRPERLLLRGPLTHGFCDISQKPSPRLQISVEWPKEVETTPHEESIPCCE
jgi:hypothetical protein